MSAREREVRQCAADLLAHLGVTEPPVDPAWIARRLGLTIQERALPPEVFSALWKDGDRFGIIVSESCPTTAHLRFSLAHELGHYHLDGHLEQAGPATGGLIGTAEGRDEGREARLEAEANWFASELLAPTAYLAARIRQIKPSIETVIALAQEFGTSLTMMANRHAELTDRILATVRCLDGSFERVFLSARLRECEWHNTLAPGAPVPRGTATSSLTRDSVGLEDGWGRSSAGMACDWFIGAPTALEIEEDAIWLASYGRVLTLLLGKRGMRNST